MAFDASKTKSNKIQHGYRKLSLGGGGDGLAICKNEKTHFVQGST